MWVLLLMLRMEQIHKPFNKSVKSCLIHLYDYHFFCQYQPKRPFVFKAKFRWVIHCCKRVLKCLLMLTRQGKRFFLSLSMRAVFGQGLSFFEVAAACQEVKHLEVLCNSVLVLVVVYFLEQISFLFSPLLWFLSYSFTGRRKKNYCKNRMVFKNYWCKLQGPAYSLLNVRLLYRHVLKRSCQNGGDFPCDTSQPKLVHQQELVLQQREDRIDTFSLSGSTPHPAQKKDLFLNFKAEKRIAL